MIALSVKPSSQACYTHMKIAFSLQKKKTHTCAHTHKVTKKINRISKINITLHFLNTV